MTGGFGYFLFAETKHQTRSNFKKFLVKVTYFVLSLEEIQTIKKGKR